MDNDREIDKEKQSTDIVERSKMIFLREAINEFSRRQQQYDLGAEFAKTKKNRSIYVPLTIIALILVFGVVVVGVTRYIQSSSLAIQVNIDDFADVNLRDVLNEAQRLQNQLDAAQRELRGLQDERQTRIGQFERARDREIGLLADQGLSAAARSAREQQIRTTAAQEIASVRGELDPEIAHVESRIEELQSAIAQYDSQQLEQAREQEQILNNQQQLFELEMDELREQYESQLERMTAEYDQEVQELEAFQEEFARNIRARHANEITMMQAAHREEIESLLLRFNPTFENDPLARLLAASAPAGAREFAGPGGFRTVLAQENAAGSGEYAALRRQYEDVTVILNALQDIPFENSVPPALDQLDLRVRDLVRRYDRMWRTLGDSIIRRDDQIDTRDTTIARREAEIARYRYSLSELTRQQGDPGYIIDARETGAIVVYVNPILSVSTGTIGYVFRRDDEFVGTVRFTETDGTAVAHVVELVEDMELRPFDKVLIEVQEDD